MTDNQYDPETSSKLNQLCDLALSLGSDNATLLPAEKIKIDPQLAALCAETRCPNYGQSPTCPPNVRGPEWFIDYRKNTPYALFLRIKMKMDQMYSEQRNEIAKLLHFIVAEIEKEAKQDGFVQSTGFAGGSCKAIFCHDHYTCEVLQGSGECRNPDSSRPSISGYGVDTNHLLQEVGWVRTTNSEVDAKETSSRYGLILIG